MRKYNFNDVSNALDELSLQTSDTLFLFLLFFVRFFFESSGQESVCDVFLKLIQQRISPTGTIVVPCFNFDFCTGKTFDRWNTASEGMGVFSEYVRRFPAAIRSKHPMQSVAAIGGLAKEICEPDTYSSFAVDGPFSMMIEAKAKLLFVGAPFQSASLIHYVEERLNVPYRYWKSFSGMYLDHKNDAQEMREYSMYVRNMEEDPKLKLALLQDELASRGLLHISSLGMGQLIYCSFESFLEVALEMLSNDPYSLLENPGSCFSSSFKGIDR